MNNENQIEVKENVLAGIVGAFIFSLAGGILWFVLYLVGFIASISGLVGVVCAIKGYSFFAKKESTKGIVIATIIAVLVIVIAWYFGIAYEIYDIHRYWLEIGEIDYTVTFFDAVSAVPLYLGDPELTWSFLVDLLVGLLFCAVGAGSYVVNKIKNSRQSKSVAVEAEATVENTATAEIAEKTETAEPVEPAVNEEKKDGEE